jgi:type IV pilus assembly protein PilY1
MTNRTSFPRRLCLLSALAFQVFAPSVMAAPVDVSSPRAAIPPNVVTTSTLPMVMLAVSKDHSIFGPVYTDFEDLDGDGVIDTTFKPTFKYYGYFDSTKCYAYSTTASQFEPAALATIVPTTVDGKTLDRYTCSSSASHWSGNFLNWTTMTRLDVVRKMLYGGSRSTDTDGTTILEGTELTWDAHSFVKYYRGTDIRDYTPFTTAALTKTTGANANVYAGLSICTTGSTDVATKTAATPPVMRLVKGNVRFWSTVEIELCRWKEDYTSPGTFGPKLARYYKDADKGNGGIAHETTIPSRATDGAVYGGIGPDLNVRVKVCDPSWLGEERCQAFPISSTTNFKPYGLLQEFGYPTSGGAARAEFGLITGSYDLNHTAGALRKNMGDLSDEIHPTTGVFCHSTSAGCAGTLADGRSTGTGAIKALDAILLYGRTSKTYGGGNTPSASGEGNLPAWGNPIGEMLVQSLQYYAYNGTSPTPTNPATTTNDVSVGLPVAAWKDPLSNWYTTRTNLYGNATCRPMYNLALSPSALSFDGQAGTPFATLPNRALGALDSYTDLIGVTEGLANTVRSVGAVSGKGLTAADDKNSCAAKTVGALSNVNGICPEAPAMGGTYQVAGAALYGNTSKIRTIASPPVDLKYVEGALKVKTMAASLTGGSPRIDIPIPGSNPVKYVYITPESVQNGGKVSAPLTFASISSYQDPVTKEGYGSFIVSWNDVLMGGDYDMDITGFLRYDLIANAASPSGWDIKITTDIPNACGGGAGTHGFSVIGVTTATGTNANGRYLTHQHFSNNALTGMPPTTEYLCGDTAYRARTGTFGGTLSSFSTTVCNVTTANYCVVKDVDFPVSMTFRMVGEVDALIRDPLWYAAKYGYFKSSTKNADSTYTDVDLPASQSAWDNLKSDGTSGSDGVPDGYFLARRPEVLEAQLRRALTDLTGKSNALPTTSASQLVVGTFR